MIRLLVAGEGLPPLPETEAALKLAGWWRSYGAGQAFVRFYETENRGLLGCMGQVALAAVPAADADEAALFLTMQPDLRIIRSDPAFIEAVAAIRAGEVTGGTVMRLDKPADEVAFADTPPLTAAYELLSLVFGEGLPAFEDWYVDTSHRLRHKCGRMAGATVGDTLAGVAMTTAEGDSAGLIGGVATHPAYRGQGIAHRLVMALASALQNEGKQVWLSPKNDYAHALYSRWGFVPAGEWSELRWKD